MSFDHIDAIQEISIELGLMSHYLEQASKNAPDQHAALIRANCEKLSDMARSTKKLTDALRSQVVTLQTGRPYHQLCLVKPQQRQSA